MIKRHSFLLIFSVLFLTGCENTSTKDVEEQVIDLTDESIDTNGFQFVSETFSDLLILQYEVNQLDELSTNQKRLVYYLYEAGMSGRDILWDQNYRHNIEIRNALEHIVINDTGDKTTKDWENFMIYVKRIWFSNGIHHHYSMVKIKPKFSKNYLNGLLVQTEMSLRQEVIDVIFNDKDNKKVSLDTSGDIVLNSATNFYQADITQAEVEAYYAKKIDKSDPEPVEYGLNSKLIKDKNGVISEAVWKVGGMYNDAIVEIVKWVELAKEVAENEDQAYALGLLIEYYETGDLRKWADFNIAWSKSIDGDIDYIQGFVEAYSDPMGMKGTYESVIQIKDFEAGKRMSILADNVQWFEDESPIMNSHKKANVTGVTYNVVNVVGQSGDSSPNSPIGINLPNSNWIRVTHGSKSVSLGNIVESKDQSAGHDLLNEFAFDQEEIRRYTKYGKLASKCHTAMHEVIGHASGKINFGVGSPAETLKSYSLTLEEARADLVSLYYLMDEKLVELGVMDNLEVGKAEYDNYIRIGLLIQLRQLEAGTNLEESHMRNRQLVASWAYEKGLENEVIKKVIKDGKTFYDIQDYTALRDIFGQLLRDIQRIKSEGDYNAGKELVEQYGVKVDIKLHEEVLRRSERLNMAPYTGFINPILEPVFDADSLLINIKTIRPSSFEEQMLYYSKNYGFLK